MSCVSHPIRLNIGGTEPLEGWKILNIQPGPLVDFVGSCTDLSQFTDNSIAEIYASHVFEHLDYTEFKTALREVLRILQPEGLFHIGVPDMDALCQLYLRPDVSIENRIILTKMIYGGQQDPYDYHHIGLNWQVLIDLLGNAGFRLARRVDQFGLFPDDCSTYDYLGIPISLNVIATK
ncbi:MAG: methyltransferase domain-containing protein [Pirellulaceae bacterium]|nr:methyltransferase domain-containing protein [Pirellulaceae bacterium]